MMVSKHTNKKTVLFVLVYALKSKNLEIEWCICRGHALVDAKINVCQFVSAWMTEVLTLAILDQLETQETQQRKEKKKIKEKKRLLRGLVALLSKTQSLKSSQKICA